MTNEESDAEMQSLAPGQSEVAADVAALRSDYTRQDGLISAANMMAFLGVLTILGALIGGIVLITHTVPADCDEFGCSGTSSPWVGVGAAVLIGGLLQSVPLFVLAHLCKVTSGLRAKLA